MEASGHTGTGWRLLLLPSGWGLAWRRHEKKQDHQPKIQQHLRILSATLWGCTGVNLKKAFHHIAFKMGILIKLIEPQSCTSIIPGEWGPGKAKKQLRNFSIPFISEIYSTQKPPVPTNGMKAQSCAVQRENFFKMSVDGCARCWALFSIHPLAVQERNKSHWKEGSSWRMKEKPTSACNDKSCSLIQHCCRDFRSCPASRQKRFDSQSLFSPSVFTDIDLYENGF